MSRSDPFELHRRHLQQAMQAFHTPFFGFQDPFFSSMSGFPDERLRGVVSVEEVSDDDSSAVPGAHSRQLANVRGSSNYNNPFATSPMFGGGFHDPMFSGFGGGFSSGFSSTTTVISNGRGVTETRRVYRTSDGVEEESHTRALSDGRSRTVQKEKDHSRGIHKEVHHLQNVREEDIGAFESEWASTASDVQGYGTHNSHRNDRQYRGRIQQSQNAQLSADATSRRLPVIETLDDEDDTVRQHSESHPYKQRHADRSDARRYEEMLRANYRGKY